MKMTAKEYLNQAWYLDQRINSKLEQIASLNTLALKATSTITGMPHSPNRASAEMEDTIAKIVDFQAEINEEIDALVDLKQDISKAIKAVPEAQFQTLLEKRYLCFEPWEKIAVEMGYDMRWLYRLHGRALALLQTQLDGAIEQATKSH